MANNKLRSEKTRIKAKLFAKTNPDFNEEFVNVKALKKQFVSDGIGDDFKTWTPRTPVFISAPTGLGKNSFAEGPLLKSIMETGKSVLLLSNRNITDRKQKKKISEIVGCSNILENYTKKGLDGVFNFGCCTVKTYQRLIQEFDKGEFEKYNRHYDYVVLDEIHFIVTDSLFNSKTELFLKGIETHFKNAVRIYMTATPDECLPFIVNEEEGYDRNIDKFVASNIPFYKTLCPREMKMYSFPYDYSYLNTLYFNDIDEIVTRIKNDNTDEKWLIFVSSIKSGEELQRKIDNSIFLDAGSKSSNEKDGLTFESIVNNERFEPKVLLATCFMENGINIHDLLLKNIVILTCDKTQYIQMLGRKRKGINEYVNLFMHSKSVQTFTGKIHMNNKKIEAISMYKKNIRAFMDIYYSGDEAKHELVKNLFYFDKFNKLVLNHIAEIKLYNDKKFYENMKSKLLVDSAAFIKEQLTWLSKKYNLTSWLSYNDKNTDVQDFRNFLEFNVGKVMSKDSFKNFGDEFKSKFVKAYGLSVTDRPDRSAYGVALIRKKFKELNLSYIVQCKNGSYSLNYGKK